MKSVKKNKKVFRLIFIALAIFTGFFLMSGIGLTQSISSRNMQIAQKPCPDPQRCCKYGDKYYPVGYRLGPLICRFDGKWERQ